MSIQSIFFLIFYLPCGNTKQIITERGQKMRILLIAIILFLLVMLDYKLGERVYKSALKKKEYPNRQSDLTLFTTGEALFNDYFAELKQAKYHIHILFYIVRNDDVSQQLLNLLKKKAEEGVEVRVLVDWIGSLGLSRKTIQSLKESGIQFAFSNKPFFPFFFYKLNERNHRKITVIDGKIGYLGGFNVGKEYMGQDPKFGNWRDYHLKIIGEGVQDLQTQFRTDWKQATGVAFSKTETYFPPLPQGKMKHQLIPTDGMYLQEKYIDLIKQAKREIIIGSPYFIPGKKVMKALLDAAERGVHITIITPMQADHMFVKEAAMPYFHQLLKANCDIYRFYDGFYHAKVIVIDDEVCDIGTANFDKRSFFINYEMNGYIYDKAFIQSLKEAIARDLETSEKLTMPFFQNRTIVDRVKETIATILSPLL
jgi:cardiolipin synthase